MQFSYRYRITYETGQTNASPEGSCVYVDASNEEYKQIIQAILNDKPLAEMEGVPELLGKMRENVEWMDRYFNTDGSRRSKPLKKPRKISKIEFFPLERDAARLKKMKDPFAELERPREEMKVYREDGSYVKLSTEFGRVEISDSASGKRCFMEIDTFLQRISF